MWIQQPPLQPSSGSELLSLGELPGLISKAFHDWITFLPQHIFKMASIFQTSAGVHAEAQLEKKSLYLVRDEDKGPIEVVCPAYRPILPACLPSILTCPTMKDHLSELS